MRMCSCGRSGTGLLSIIRSALSNHDRITRPHSVLALVLYSCDISPAMCFLCAPPSLQCLPPPPPHLPLASCSCRSAEKKPRVVAGLQGVKIVQAALGGWHCLALDDNGQVHAWGGNEYAQCDEQVSIHTRGESREAQVWWGHVFVSTKKGCVLPLLPVRCMNQQPSHSQGLLPTLLLGARCRRGTCWCPSPACRSCASPRWRAAA